MSVILILIPTFFHECPPKLKHGFSLGFLFAWLCYVVVYCCVCSRNRRSTQHADAEPRNTSKYPHLNILAAKGRRARTHAQKTPQTYQAAAKPSQLLRLYGCQSWPHAITDGREHSLGRSLVSACMFGNRKNSLKTKSPDRNCELLCLFQDATV